MAKKPAGRDALEDLSLALNVLAYFANHEGATVFEAGEELGVDGPDIQDILWELWTCGVPGYAHGDLIDLDPDPRAVTVINPQGLDRPMRLTPFEAAMLLVVLHDVVDSVSPRAAGAVRSAAGKIAPLAGGAAIDDLDAGDEPGPEEAARTAVVEALEGSRRIAVTYYTASSDRRSRRELSPGRLLNHDGGQYLFAHDHDAGEARWFKLSRMADPEVLDAPAEPVAGADDIDEADPFELKDKAGEIARVRIRREAAWLADYAPIDVAGEAADGWLEASLPVARREWATRFLLENGDRIALAGPIGLARAVDDAARAALEAYSGGDSPTPTAEGSD